MKCFDCGAVFGSGDQRTKLIDESSDVVCGNHGHPVSVKDMACSRLYFRRDRGSEKECAPDVRGVCGIALVVAIHNPSALAFSSRGVRILHGSARVANRLRG